MRSAGNLATLFMLEDRTSARTNAGEDTNEFNPETIPSSAKYAERFVGNLTVDSWSNGSNGTVEKAMLDLQVWALRVPPTPSPEGWRG